MSTDSLSPQTQRSESRLAVETVGLDVIGLFIIEGVVGV